MNLDNKWKSWIWKDIDKKFVELNNRSGKAYSLNDCIYLDMGFEYTPNVFNPGNKDINERINELAEDEECANTTIFRWYKTDFQI